jgi:superfamily II RNA helicase
LWELGREGYLCNNVGVHGHILLLTSLIKYYEELSSLNARELAADELFIEIQAYIEPISILLSKATSKSMEEQFKVQYGSTGPRQYYFRLCKIINSVHPSFCPDGYLEWEETQNQEKIEETDKKIKDINSKVGSIIGKVFKKMFGNDQYIEKAVGKYKSEMVSDALNKRMKEGKLEVPVEAYFDFIDFKKIVEIKDYWSEFKKFFDIPEPGEKGLAKNIKWMDRINELRRLPAHASEHREYAHGDFDYVDYIHTALLNNIESNLNEV